jgi:hypothetical protein
MNSTEWQQRIADLKTEIATHEARLLAIPDAKAAVITEPKKLQTIEDEEMKLPALIDGLKKRFPILERALEDALKTEAGGRQAALAQEAGEVAARISATAGALRAAMQGVLDLIGTAHADWAAYESLLAEADYLHVRFSVAVLPIPRADYVTVDEQQVFASRYQELFQHSVSPPHWTRMRTEWQAAEQRKEQRRVAAIENALTPAQRDARDRQIDMDNQLRLAEQRQLAEDARIKAYNDKLKDKVPPREPAPIIIKSY